MFSSIDRTPTRPGYTTRLISQNENRNPEIPQDPRPESRIQIQQNGVKRLHKLTRNFQLMPRQIWGTLLLAALFILSDTVRGTDVVVGGIKIHITNKQWKAANLPCWDQDGKSWRCKCPFNKDDYDKQLPYIKGHSLCAASRPKEFHEWDAFLKNTSKNLHVNNLLKPHQRFLRLCEELDLGEAEELDLVAAAERFAVDEKARVTAEKEAKAEARRERNRKIRAATPPVTVVPENYFRLNADVEARDDTGKWLPAKVKKADGYRNGQTTCLIEWDHKKGELNWKWLPKRQIRHPGRRRLSPGEKYLHRLRQTTPYRDSPVLTRLLEEIREANRQ